MKLSDLSATAEANKDKFITFMTLIGLSEKSREGYISGLLSCSELILPQLATKGYATLFDVTNQAQVRYYQQLLEKNPIYIERNHRGNNRYMASVANYVKYVDFLFIFVKKN